jgi:hypothetical protein
MARHFVDAARTNRGLNVLAVYRKPEAMDGMQIYINA